MSRRSALLIIDMQNDVLKKLAKTGELIVPAIQKILNACREKNIPVIYLSRVHRKSGIDVELFRTKRFQEEPFLVRGTKGAETIEALCPLSTDYIIEKQRFSGFFQTDLLMLLMRLKVDSLIITGVQTPNCVRSTVTDAIGYDYEVTLLKDATAAMTREIHESNLLDMHNMGVSIITVDAFLQQMSF